MTHCERCRDRLLDHVYGLLEGNDLHETREHVKGCSECQVALEAVRAEQKLLACAARAVTEIPEFTLPSNEPGIVPISTGIQAPVANAFGSAKGATKGPLWRRGWVGWTVAAALLVAVSAALSSYRHRLHTYEGVLAQKRQEHKAVAERFAALPITYAALQHSAIQELRANAGPYLHVVGPTTLEPGAKAHLHIRAQHPEGTPRQVQSKSDFARIDLRVKVVDVQTHKVKAINLKCDDDGRALVELDAGAAGPNAKLQVIVEAKTALGTARVQETMRILAPTYVTRIDTNKIAYQFQDVLFFRVLVLDRYTLQPPSEPIAMHIELVNPQGKAVRSLDMLTGAGGVLGREFAIDDQFVEGNYTLNVRPVAAAKVRVQSASHSLEIVRKANVPEFKFDQEDYRAGDNVTGVYRGQQPLPKQAMIDGKKVPVTSHPAAPGMSGAGFGRKSSNETKVAESAAIERPQSFAIPIPANLPANAERLPITLQFPDGQSRTANIPLAPTDFAIDFFPEGGDLIAGVQNRVFYRVRSKSGQPVTGDGQVMLLTAGKNDIVDSTYQVGMGYFDFLPHPKEAYTARITTPTKIENVKEPFARLGMRSEGVVIQVADPGDEHAPKAVGSQGDAIRVTLRQQGPARKLLLLAQCRGQIVDQRWVDLKREPVDVTLQPTLEAVGMIRVTAYELHENMLIDKLSAAAIGFAHAQVSKQAAMLQPVAERLVYRTAIQRLDLGFTLEKQKLLPGPVAGKATARDEKGQPATAWLLASVVDERFQTRPRSLSAHFFLLNEIRTGADLDNAQIILHDSPESTQMLERFLGTHGWRRFVRTEPGLAHLNAGQPAIFSREILPATVVQKQYEDKLAHAVTPLHTTGFAQQIELEDLRLRSAEAVEAAASDLRVFQENVQSTIRMSLAVLMVSLLGISLILMSIGLYRILRAHKLATPSFGGAFACLAVCIGLVFLNTWLGPINVPDPVGNFVQGPPGWKVRQGLDDQFALLPSVRHVTSKPLVGAFPLPAAQQTERDKINADAKADDAGGNLAKAVNDQLANALSRRGLGEGTFPVLADRGVEHQKLRSENVTLNHRFNDAIQIGNSARGANAADIPQQPTAKPAVKADGGQQKMLEGSGREYSHQHVKNVLTDTLLWHPNLWLADGNAEIRFDIGDGNATYRVLLLGHSPTGRFGFYETRLDVLSR